jgi:hypothetical protein
MMFCSTGDAAEVLILYKQGNEELRSKLGEKFGVRGIPSLVLLNDKCEVILYHTHCTLHSTRLTEGTHLSRLSTWKWILVS